MRFWIILLSVMLTFACGKKEIRKEIAPEDRPAEMLRLGNQLYDAKDYENAFRAFGDVYHNYPTSREYVDAAIGLSKCYGALADYEHAFDLIYSLLKENLIPSKVPEIYNTIASFYEKSAGISEELKGEGTADYKTAIDYLNKAIQYPNSEDRTAKSYAQFKIGTLNEDLEEYDQAIAAYQATINGYAGTEWALRAEQNMLELQQKLQRRQQYQQSGLMPASTPAAATDTPGATAVTTDTSEGGAAATASGTAGKPNLEEQSAQPAEDKPAATDTSSVPQLDFK